MAKEDEFDRILKFFKMNPADRAEHFEDIFNDSADFFERLNYILKNGTIDEKRHIIEELQQLQQLVQEETSKLTEMSGLSESELKSFATNPDNFTSEHWEVIEKARERIQHDALEASELLNFKPPGAGEGEQKSSSGKPKKPKKPPGPGKSGWVKS